MFSFRTAAWFCFEDTAKNYGPGFIRQAQTTADSEAMASMSSYLQ
jgi:hypothetical protein